MCSDQVAIHVESLAKTYRIYANPKDRLKQSIWGGRRTFFKEFDALKNLSFSVNRGETVGIVGRNGSGKSTLLQLICGTLEPSHGTCQVRGRVSALLELGAGFNPEFTGRENVYLNGAILGISQEEMESRYEGIVAFAGIGDKIDQPVKTYSSGMYVRLAFAVAVAVDPDILIVDEALAVGDEMFQRKCFSRIRDIQARGGTILFVSHAAATIVEICNRALLIDGGELLLEGAPKHIMAQYHRLLFAPADKAFSIREEIKASTIKESFSHDAHVIVPSTSKPQQKEVQEWFDPHFHSESKVTYPARGAEISQVRIETLSGERVNYLQRGMQYRYCFEVSFAEDAYGVKCGMFLKTKSGIELGGAATSTEDATIPHIAAGTRLAVSFTFSAKLLPGTYFINCGCSAIVNSERVFMHRIIDAYAFKIMPEEASFIAGMVDFDIEPAVTLIPSTTT